MFSLRAFIKTGLLGAVGIMADYQIILNAAGWLEKNVLLEEDLAEIQAALDAREHTAANPDETGDNPESVNNSGENADNPESASNSGENGDNPESASNSGENGDNPENANNSGENADNPENANNSGENILQEA